LISSERLVISDLNFELRRSEKRKTIGVTIERDGSLTLNAPQNCPLEIIERIASEKQAWIYARLAEKELLFCSPRPKEYVTGEGFNYLGRSYRLLLVQPATADDPPLSLSGGRFLLRRDAIARAEQHFINWYISNGLPWLQNRVRLLATRIEVQPGEIRVQDLGFRWGSCGQNGRLNFHWRTMLLPPRLIEYVVAHELIHLREPLHNPGFWHRLSLVMPDYEVRKQYLAKSGGELC